MANVLEMNKWLNEEDPDRVKYQSWMMISPIQGKKFKVRLNRTRFLIKSAERSYFCEKRGIIFLYSHLSFEYELNFYQADFESSKLQFKVLNGNPAKINSVYCSEAFLQRKDRLQIGYHFLEFHEQAAEINDSQRAIPLSERAVQSAISVYLEGETGTGKSFMAKKIHDQSGVRGRFVHLNLSAISPQLFESELFGHLKGSFTGATYDKGGAIYEANGGTLFLDEINSLSLELQSKLLLILDSGKFYPVGSSQEKKSSFRLITSSNENLEELVKAGRMRKDFYFRLVSGFTVKLPKINSNEFYFYQVLNELENELDIFVSANLKRYYFQLNWEGNIRELKQYLIKKKVHQGKKLSLDSMDEEMYQKMKGQETISLLNFETIKSLEEFKNDYIKLMYHRTGGSIAQTSRILKIAPGTVRVAVRSPVLN